MTSVQRSARTRELPRAFGFLPQVSLLIAEVKGCLVSAYRLLTDEEPDLTAPELTATTAVATSDNADSTPVRTVASTADAGRDVARSVAVVRTLETRRLETRSLRSFRDPFQSNCHLCVDKFQHQHQGRRTARDLPKSDPLAARAAPGKSRHSKQRAAPDAKGTPEVGPIYSSAPSLATS